VNLGLKSPLVKHLQGLDYINDIFWPKNIIEKNQENSKKFTLLIFPNRHIMPSK